MHQDHTIVIGALVIPGLSIWCAYYLLRFLIGDQNEDQQNAHLQLDLCCWHCRIVFLTWQSAAHHDWEAAEKQGKIVQSRI